jgi:hypothetical protein
VTNQDADVDDVRGMALAAALHGDVTLLDSVRAQLSGKEGAVAAEAVFGDVLDELVQTAIDRQGPDDYVKGAAFLLAHGASVPPERGERLAQARVVMTQADGPDAGDYEYSFATMLVAAGPGLALPALRRLVETGALDPGAPAGFTRGTTLLHYAALMGDEPLVDYLLAKGLDPSAKDAVDQDVARYARHGEHFDLAERLVTECARVAVKPKTVETAVAAQPAESAPASGGGLFSKLRQAQNAQAARKVAETASDLARPKP